MTIEERIKRIEGRLGKATRGEWEVRDGFVRSHLSSWSKVKDISIKTQCSWVAECKRGEGFDNPEANAEFIAHSKEDITFLLSELKRRGEALSQYSNPKNWSNGGFNGEYDTIWMGKGLRGSDIAQQALHPEGVK